MKKFLRFLTIVAVAGISWHAEAAVGVSETDLGLVSTIPGSASDFYLFGGSNPSDLTNFSVTGTANQYGGDTRYSTITLPNGTPNVQTGIEYQYGATNNLATVTLGSSPSFNYGDFNLYFTYGNEPGSGGDGVDADVFLIIGGTTYNVPVTENSTDYTGVKVEEFNVTGLSEGDSIILGATKGVGDNVSYIGAVSFEEAPEPSTYAMLLGGLVVVAVLLRRKSLLRA
jgi:hypothetical protein